MASRARNVVIVTDSSKFGRSAFAMIRTMDQINKIITDDGIPDSTIKELERAGVSIVIA
jgi:DeoR family transcriptional regulator of aga operon